MRTARLEILGASVSVGHHQILLPRIPKWTSLPYLTSPRGTLQYELFYGAFDVTYHIPSQTEWQTYVCENITFPQHLYFDFRASQLVGGSSHSLCACVKSVRSSLVENVLLLIKHMILDEILQTQENFIKFTHSQFYEILCFENHIQNCTENGMLYDESWITHFSLRIVCFFTAILLMSKGTENGISM